MVQSIVADIAQVSTHKTLGMEPSGSKSMYYVQVFRINNA